jgi:hypothetical protein
MPCFHRFAVTLYVFVPVVVVILPVMIFSLSLLVASGYVPWPTRSLKAPGGETGELSDRVGDYAR